jgi:hypothetical protein
MTTRTAKGRATAARETMLWARSASASPSDSADACACGAASGRVDRIAPHRSA